MRLDFDDGDIQPTGQQIRVNLDSIAGSHVSHVECQDDRSTEIRDLTYQEKVAFQVAGIHNAKR